MPSRPIRHTSARLTAAAAAFAAGSLPASAQTGTYDLVLTAHVRDFPATNPDFCKPMNIGTNWVEGLVAPTLGPSGVPTYTGMGKRVTVPANDNQGRNIAQGLVTHTDLQDLPDVHLATAPVIAGTAKMDTWDSNLGFYVPTSPGPVPEVSTTTTMPVVTVPTLSTYIASYLMTGVASGTLNSSFRCGSFTLRNQYTLTILGDVTIVCDGNFTLENSSNILIGPNSRLTVYVYGTALFENGNKVNMNTGDHTLFTLYKLGIGDVDLGNEVDVCGTLIAPQGRLYCHNTGEFYGDVTANQVRLSNSAQLHVPEPPETVCKIIDDTPIQLGSADPGSVANGQSFDTWFKDTPGVNMESQARLLFQKQLGGDLTFSSDDFRPIDGQLLGAGTWEPNRNFTLEMDGEFTYTPCSNQYFEFSGDGDAYVYIDGKLVLELAGNNTGMKQFVDFDRLGLDPAQPHTIKFFYAQRSCSPSKFKVRTNVELRTEYVVEYETVAIMD